ncbi:MAG: glycoside hydrolase family 88 protein [Halovenus sp.]
MTTDLAETVSRVAEYTTTLEMEGVDWERAMAVDGWLAVDERLDDATYWVDRGVATQTSAGQFAYGSGDIASYSETDSGVQDRSRNSYNDTYFPTYNPAALAWSTLELYERTGEKRYLEAVRRQYEYFHSDHVPRTADGAISRREDKTELYTEIMHFLCPFFVRYGRIVGNDEPVDEAVEQIRLHAKHLQDPNSGLFRHIWHETPDFYPASSYWSRGVGWATAGLLDALLWLPEDHEGRAEVEDILTTTLDTLVDLQDDSGFWHQRLDERRSPLETSGTLMFAYTMRRGLDEGILDDDRYADAARKAMDACVGIVDDDGAVRRIARPPASSFAPLGVTEYGQGWFMMAASCFR